MDTPDYQFNHFKFSPKFMGFLFKGWNSYTTKDMIWMCLFSATLVLALEILRTGQEYLSYKLKVSPQSLARSVNAEGEGTSALLPAVLIPATSTHIKMHRLTIHLFKAILTMISMFIGYTLMLAVMSYNAWILIVVILSSGLTYLIFNLMRRDLRRRSAMWLNSHHEDEPQG